MGIRSRVRVEYWQNDTKVPLSNAMLYPAGSDVVSRADIEASEVARFVHCLDATWNIASLTASSGNGNLLSAGFSLDGLVESINDLKTELSEKTVTRSTNLNVAYPHPLFNTIRLVFESQSSEDFFGTPDTIRDAGHTPWSSAHNSAIQFQSDCGRFHRNATYVIKLDELNERMSASSHGFFSTPDGLQPFVFEFAVKETDGQAASFSVLHTLTLNVFKPQQAVPHACTEIVYWMRGPADGFGQVVARRRLVDFSPRIWPLSPGVGDEFQVAEIPLVLEDGNYVVDGKPFNLISVNFNVVSRRKHDGRRLPIEVTADHVPFAGGIRLSPQVTQPLLAPAIDDRGQVYVAEGVGSATMIFAPETASPGTMVFTAAQEPCEWTAQHNIRLFRGSRANAAAAGVSRISDQRSGPLCLSQEWGQP